MTLSLEEARAALVAVRSEASDAEHFDAERLDGGWCFFWSSDEDVPDGTSPWVVADTGAVKALWFTDRPEAVLQHLNAG